MLELTTPALRRRSLRPQNLASACQTSEARPYHHGDLRRVLIDAALQLAAEGAEVSVREAARRAGCRQLAPFRYFQ